MLMDRRQPFALPNGEVVNVKNRMIAGGGGGGGKQLSIHSLK